jgi:hypothetical protein
MPTTRRRTLDLAPIARRIAATGHEFGARHGRVPVPSYFADAPSLDRRDPRARQNLPIAVNFASRVARHGSPRRTMKFFEEHRLRTCVDVPPVPELLRL